MVALQYGSEIKTAFYILTFCSKFITTQTHAEGFDQEWAVW